jgi:hypothetical protein
VARFAIIAGVVLTALLLWQLWKLPAERRSKLGRTVAYTLVFALSLLVLVRFGAVLAVAVAAVAGPMVRLLPVIARLLPMWESHRQRARMGQNPQANAPGAESKAASGQHKRMTREEALAIFGLAEGCTPDDVLREYRRLMKKVHPDQGGSTYLASQLNQAKAVLLEPIV